MPLTPGSRLGPYEILAPLGAGGMGEVYRARDSRLSREVAIKVLPASLSSDPERLKRFEKEARAASSLNHPAIVTIYDIGREESISYLAMELVSGTTLRDLLAEGPLPVRRTFAIAGQVADGLAKAHGSGIVHRDLKPENVMVTKDGFAKILDFGLAKLAAPDISAGEATKSPTVSAGTEPGIVMGTVGYMSPEQARGAPLDFRSDQFAFGSVLYEMATGRRAFAGETKPEILAAIIREEPQSVASVNPKVPAPLRWIIERCLAKDPAERYASTEDLARDLRSAETHLSEISSGLAATEAAGLSRPWFRAARAFRVAAILLVGAALGALGWRLWAGRSERTPPAPSFRQLTFHRGNLLHARFAPDGQTIVYGAAWEGRPTEIFSSRIDGTESRPLGIPMSDVTAVSRGGELLILLKSDDLRTSSGTGTLAQVSLSGGAPREIAEGIHGADWFGGGGGIVAQRHLTPHNDTLEFPLGTRRLDYAGIAPRVSLDGRFIATGRGTLRGDELVVFDADGRTVWTGDVGGRRWRFGGLADGLAWHPSGDIWFSRFAGSDAGIFAATPGASFRLILKASGWVLHDIAPDGRLLIERGISRLSVRFRDRPNRPERELSWLDGTRPVGMSADLRSLLFNEIGAAGSGRGGVYRRGTDGSAAVRIADGEALAFSDDGRWALIQSMARPPTYGLVPTGVGQPVPVDLGSDPVIAALFLPGDEPRLIVSVGEVSDRAHLELVTASGRSRLGISPGFLEAAISPDGETIAYQARPKELAVCRIRNAQCRKIALTSDGSPIQWSSDGRFLFLRDYGRIPASVTRYDLASGEHIPWLTIGPEDPSAFIDISRIFLSRDGRAYVFSALEVHESSLFLVEGLK